MGNENSSLGKNDATPPTVLKDRSIRAVADFIKSGRATNIVAMTGAGISTAAGIPDFRSPKTGLYANLRRLNLPYAEAVFDITYFRQHPEPFYMLAKELYPGKFHPTISHVFMALLEKKGLLSIVFTQNIDCLERAAGVSPARICEAHGSFATQRCIECRADYPHDLMLRTVESGEVPRCRREHCGGLVKPDIVFFGEALPASFIANRRLVATADLVLIVGTSLTVYPFAGLPGLMDDGVPRLLLNRERVGDLGTRSNDVLSLGPCDDGIRELATELGWAAELETMWRDLVGDAEAERQRGRQLEDNPIMTQEMQALSENLDAALKLEDEVSDGDSGKPTDDILTSSSPRLPTRLLADPGGGAVGGDSATASRDLDRPRPVVGPGRSVLGGEEAHGHVEEEGPGPGRPQTAESAESKPRGQAGQEPIAEHDAGLGKEEEDGRTGERT